MSRESPPSIEDTIHINIGGFKHEVSRKTLKRLPNSPLATIEKSFQACYRVKKDEYFFDRHPASFNAILNFYRTGELHVPNDVCGPLFKNELEFWGIDDALIEQCCWMKYMSMTDQKKCLINFKSYNNQTEISACGEYCHGFSKLQQTVWPILNDPFYSVPAKVSV